MAYQILLRRARDNRIAALSRRPHALGRIKTADNVFIDFN